MGKSSIKRMNASQETEEKKEETAETSKTEESSVQKKTAGASTGKAASAGRKAAARGAVERKTEKKVTGTAGTKNVQPEEETQEKTGVVSRITCELPIYLM